jgi:hypothetical protein
MPPEISTVLASVSQLGIGGLVFIIWFFDNKKIEGYKILLGKVLDMNVQMQEDRKQLIKIVGDHATFIERNLGILQRVESSLTAIANHR